MQTIEFQTTVKEIMPALPADKREALGTHGDNETVRVIVMTAEPQAAKDLLRDAQEKGYDDFLEYLFDHPLTVTNTRRFTRDELHER